MGNYSCIKDTIEKQILLGRQNFILYPFGEQGLLAKQILNEVFGIQEKAIIDNHLCKYNSAIKDITCLSDRAFDDCILLLASNNEKIYDELRLEVRRYICSERIVDIFGGIKQKPKVGKYSYGPLCSNCLVESIGSFCSFGPMTDVVQNHAVNYISTHPFLYCNVDESIKEDWNFMGVEPKGKVHKEKKVVIGNDVWLSRNVVITNGAEIGNGVIAGAGAVITKDVPDYAVIGGVPARIIRFRYTQEQIEALNEIQWWNWPDEKIREYYNDFYKDIETFIEKHKKP